jgi:ferric-dicitrate binding protein FerR (iron transport regulator)
MAPAEAAALFIARQSEGLAANERQLLEEWLARDDTHRRAFENAERAWRSFDHSADDEVLAAMRAHALAPRRLRRPRWLPAAAAAAAVLVALTFMLARSWAPDADQPSASPPA